jgi:hypothetical protein
MAIYATPRLPAGRERAGQCGVDLQIVRGPDRHRDPGGIGFIFWAMQISFLDDRGQIVAGGHFGLQWFVGAPRTGFGAINWGVYDDVVGHGAVLRGSRPVDPAFVDIGIGPSWGYDYDYGDWCRFRCFRSPRQDWTTAELDRGDGQPRAYRRDQRPDETAFRVTIENLSAGTGPVVFRDVLVKQAAAHRPMGYPVLWTESGAAGLATGPVARFANLVWDQPGTVTEAEASYHADHADTDCGIEGGAIRQAGACPRRHPAGTVLRWP